MAFVVFTVSSGFGDIRGKSMGSVFVYTKVHPYHAVSFGLVLVLRFKNI